MKVVSLFDGCSCAFQALKNAGIHIERYYASEVDKYAILVSQMNHKHIVHIGDVKQIFFKDCLHYGNIARHEVNQVDLLIGGPPCQDLSIAGKRKGLGGKRSGLFWEFARLLKEIKPTRFIMENVASMSKEARDTISKELGVEPIMINSALVTAQNRKRLYWTNIPGVVQPEDRGILLKDIILDQVDEKYYVTDLKVKQSEGNTSKECIRIGHFNTGGQGDRIYSEEGKSVCLSANGGGRGPKTGLYHIQQKARGFNKGGTHEEKSPTLTANRREMNNVVRKLTPIECERLQGLPDDYTAGVSNTQRYKMIGNGFTVPVIEHILSFLPK